MLRLLLLLALLIGAVVVLTGAATARRVFTVLAALMVLYAVLKMTGVIEAIAPDRAGVF